MNVTLFSRFCGMTVLVTAFFLGCTPPASTNATSGNPKDVIVPRAAHGIVLDNSSPAYSPDNSGSANQEPKISLEDNLLVQEVYEENIDTDPAIEQIIVYKIKNDQEDLLHVMVVDFDGSRGIYAPTWQDLTRASNIKTFFIRVMDLNGDGLPELACQGVDKSGELTLDLFKAIDKDSTFPLQYASILSISADISLDIQRPFDTGNLAIGDDVGAANQASGGRPIDILAQSKDLESQSQLDMVQTLYRWRASQDHVGGGQYLVESTKKIPGATVQEAALDQIFRSSTADFERKYLAGGWVHSFVNQRKKSITQILFFDPEARTIRLIEGDRMESHEWPQSRKPAYGGAILANLINENYQSLHTSATIQAKELNLLTFSLQDRNDWTGDFTRLPLDKENQLFSRTSRTIPTNSLILSGLYRSENGQEIVFSSPHFTWRTDEVRRQGGYLSYKLNNVVMEFKFINSRGLVEKEAYYIAKLEENDQAGAKIVRILTLRPALLTVTGVSPDLANPDSIHLEQRASDITP